MIPLTVIEISRLIDLARWHDGQLAPQLPDAPALIAKLERMRELQARREIINRHPV